MARRSDHDVESQLGDRLRAFRRARGLTLAALATKTGLSKGFLSQLERGAKIPSISSLLKVAASLSINVGALFDTPTAVAPPYSLVRRGERQPFTQAGSRYGYNDESIAFRKHAKRMEPFIMAPPRRLGRKMLDHDGEEMMFVLSGRAELTLGRELIVLEPGDCVYFDASTPHRTRSLGKGATRLLVVVSSLGGA